MGARQARTSVASRVSYLLEPKNWLIVTVIMIGGHAADRETMVERARVIA